MVCPRVSNAFWVVLFVMFYFFTYTTRQDWTYTQVRSADNVEYSDVAQKTDIQLSESCSVAAWNALTTEGPLTPMVAPQTPLPLHLTCACTRFVYNRVPKCASRTLIGVFSRLGLINNFTTIFINRKYKIDKNLEVVYRNRMSAVENSRFVLISHHFFHNFSNVYPKSLTYLNVVREPSAWFQSVFNYHKYTTVGGPWWKDKELGPCVRDDECFQFVRTGWGPLKFLCGQSIACDPNQQSVVSAVKSNLARHYFLVGMKEALPEFAEVLEHLVPGMFHGMSRVFSDTQAQLLNKTKTLQVDHISSDDLEILHRKMSVERELYSFVKQKFYRILAAVREMKRNNNR